jgi:hypothetical protein
MIRGDRDGLRAALGKAQAHLNYIHVWSHEADIVEEQVLKGIAMTNAALKADGKGDGMS